MSKGDHIYIECSGYTHHGIDCGDGTVIHYTGNVKQKDYVIISRTPYETFACGRPVFVKEHSDSYSADVVVSRAESRLNENIYDLLTNNCEHFAIWCKVGEQRSDQVNGAVYAAGGAAAGAGVAATVGGMGLVGAFGGVAIGAAPVVAAGAVAGTAVYGAAEAIREGDTTALGDVAIGAATGVGISAAVGGMGLAIGGTAVAIGMAPLAIVGGIAGLAFYGAKKLLNQQDDGGAASPSLPKQSSPSPNFIAADATSEEIGCPACCFVYQESVLADTSGEDNLQTSTKF